MCREERIMLRSKCMQNIPMNLQVDLDYLSSISEEEEFDQNSSFYRGMSSSCGFFDANQSTAVDQNEQGSSHEVQTSRAENNELCNEYLTTPVEKVQMVKLIAELGEASPESPSDNDFLTSFSVLPENFNPENFPATYKENSAKEGRLLKYADNFLRQYIGHFPDRKLLFLTPENECNVRKFVCTTLRPTQLPHTEVYNWEGAAKFIADYLSYVPLNPPTELPRRLLSPATVLRIQQGTCFDYANLLCSLLIGVGYDAYVLSGYATRETCLVDQRRTQCPSTVAKVREETGKIENRVKKYIIKPPKDFISRAEIIQEAKAIKAKNDEIEKERQDKEKEEVELEKPPPDSLFGLRVHAWVLVLAGPREVAESFFIEPTTGMVHSLFNENYNGLESLWNQQNYWVNMQDCSDGLVNMKYELTDIDCWEYLLDMPKEMESGELLEDIDKDNANNKDFEKDYLDVARPWSVPLIVSRTDFEMKYPMGKKVMFFKKVKVELYASYLLQDGLIEKYTIYKDNEYTDLKEVRETFYNRKDKLISRIIDVFTGWVTEMFDRGRCTHLAEHVYEQAAPGPETERTMSFYHEARIDGLTKRAETFLSLTEHFVNRPDFLYYRHVDFGKRLKHFCAASERTEESLQRPIEKITERYSRNSVIPANEDIAERTFFISENRIFLKYQIEDSRIVACYREFLKPLHPEDYTGRITLKEETHSAFQVDPTQKPLKRVQIYQMLVDLMKAEERVIDEVRWSEQETRGQLDSRGQEESAVELQVEHWDTLRNIKAKNKRRSLEIHLMEERLREKEPVLDYLRPFLTQMGIVDQIVNRAQACKLREDCLQDFKQRLIHKANLIHDRFEREKNSLQKKQQWYIEHQVELSQADIQEYLEFCADATFRITTLELMLRRHKQYSPHKYIELERRLQTDQRLAMFLNPTSNKFQRRSDCVIDDD